MPAAKSICGVGSNHAQMQCNKCQALKMRLRRKANPAYAERQREACKQWKKRNYEKQLMLMRRWRKENPDRQYELMKEWCAKNPEQHRANGHAYRARRYGTAIPITKDTVKEILSKPCIDCGTMEGLTIGHLIPLVKGGTNARVNLASQCKSCNSRQGSRIHASVKTSLAKSRDGKQQVHLRSVGVGSER